MRVSPAERPDFSGSTSPEITLERTKSAPEKTPIQVEKTAKTSGEALPKSIESIRRSVAEHAPPRTEDKLNELEDTEQSAALLPTSIGRDLKQQSLNRTLKHVREHLPAPERALSRIIHKPVVDAASELGSKTVARPSGIISGGLCAFLGSTVYLYYAKHIGFRYNYLVFALLFVGGFAVGLILEMIIWLMRRPWRS